MNKNMFKLPEKVHSDKFDIMIKPYLTLSEIEVIANEMLKCENYCEMEMALHQGLLTTCCDINEFDGMEYETLKQSGLFAELMLTIGNVADIGKYIDEERDVKRQISKFLNTVSDIAVKAEKKLPKNADLKKMIGEYQKVMQDGHNK